MTTQEIPRDEAQDRVPTSEVAAEGLADIRDGIQGAALGATTVAPETDPRLQTYRAHYLRWPEDMRVRYPWETVRIRLLTDTIEGGGEPLLTAAEGLVEAVFFGMDAEGNPMFADGKEDPRDLPYCGLDYGEIRQLVRFKQGKDGKQVPTGYAMFPYEKGDNKSEKILALEAFTGKPFVRSANQWVFSWLESGENPSWPRYVVFNPFIGDTNVKHGHPESAPDRGVRRLLMGQKM